MVDCSRLESGIVERLSHVQIVPPPPKSLVDQYEMSEGHFTKTEDGRYLAIEDNVVIHSECSESLMGLWFTARQAAEPEKRAEALIQYNLAKNQEKDC